MGMDNYIEKINNKSIKTYIEFDDFLNDYRFSYEIIFCYRKHGWLDNFFRTKCKNSRAYDQIILTKDDIELFIKEIKIAIETNCSNFNKNKFFNNDINLELNSVLKNMKELLNEDFENNTIYYENCE